MRSIDETVARTRGRIEERLAGFFEAIEARPVSRLFDGAPASLVFDQVRASTLRGGKRLRGVFLSQAAALFEPGADERAAVIDAAAAFELLQTAYLIYDDLLDGDAVRRGGASAHVALARTAGGDVELGRGLAIHAAILANALSQLLLSRIEAEDRRRAAVLGIFADMQVFCVNGGVHDLLGDADPHVIADRKTAGYTTVGPMVAGAALGGAREDDLVRLARAARPLGIAFQLRDDLLGVFGSSTDTGKPSGRDLQLRKRTLLLEQGLALAGGADRASLDHLLARDAPSEDDVARAKAALERCGARAACEAQIEQLTRAYVEALAEGEYLAPARGLLVEIAWRLVGRRS